MNPSAVGLYFSDNLFLLPNFFCFSVKYALQLFLLHFVDIPHPEILTSVPAVLFSVSRNFCMEASVVSFEPGGSLQNRFPALSDSLQDLPHRFSADTSRLSDIHHRRSPPVLLPLLFLSFNSAFPFSSLQACPKAVLLFADLPVLLYSFM